MADLNDAVVHIKMVTNQMYPEVRLNARNQILADLLVQFATDDRRTYFNMDRDGYTRLDGTLILTPEQMAALEDAILEHKAQAHDPNWHIPGPDPVEIPFDAQGILHLPPEEED